jgi:hypothetical protein
MQTISVRFQTRLRLLLIFTPLFTVKPEYYSIKTGNVELVKEWPEKIRNGTTRC